ncbi:glutaredoxin family protein [Halobacillus fulvus]|nr:glutaredoxin family protein [Halobacillus fulvus]
MNKINLYMKKNCPLCDEIRSLIDVFTGEYDIHIKEIDIELSEELLEKYMLEVPVIEVNGETLDYRSIDYVSIEKRLH